MWRPNGSAALPPCGSLRQGRVGMRARPAGAALDASPAQDAKASSGAAGASSACAALDASPAQGPPPAYKK